MIVSCKGRENFTNAFSDNLNTINPNVFVKHCRNVVSCPGLLMLTLAWNIDILFEKLHVK